MGLMPIYGDNVLTPTPLTGRMQKQEKPRGPVNLDFED